MTRHTKCNVWKSLCVCPDLSCIVPLLHINGQKAVIIVIHERFRLETVFRKALLLFWKETHQLIALTMLAWRTCVNLRALGFWCWEEEEEEEEKPSSWYSPVLLRIASFTAELQAGDPAACVRPGPRKHTLLPLKPGRVCVCRCSHEFHLSPACGEPVLGVGRTERAAGLLVCRWEYCWSKVELQLRVYFAPVWLDGRSFRTSGCKSGNFFSEGPLTQRTSFIRQLLIPLRNTGRSTRLCGDRHQRQIQR